MRKMTPCFGKKIGVFETCKYFFIVRMKLEYMKTMKMRRGKDNVRVQSEQLLVPTATNCGFELLPHPPCSPDVTPSDYNLFPELKKRAERKKIPASI